MPSYNSARFAVSGLPRTQKANAIAKEIMVDSRTGLYMLATDDREFISLDAVGRQRNAINSFSDNIRLSGQRGMAIHELELAHLQLPNWVTSASNLLALGGTAYQKTFPVGMKEFRPYIDADALLANSLNELTVADTITVSLTTSIAYKNASNQTITVPYVLTGSIKNINTVTVYLDELIPSQFIPSAVVTWTTLTLTAPAPHKLLVYGVYVASK